MPSRRADRDSPFHDRKRRSDRVLRTFPDEPCPPDGFFAASSRRGRRSGLATFGILLAFSAPFTNAASLPAPIDEEIVAPSEMRWVPGGEDVELFAEMLVDASVPPGFRREAATRLGRLGTQEAAAILQAVLLGEDQIGRQAVVDGLAAVPELQPEIVSVVIQSLTVGVLTPEPAAGVLANAGPQAMAVLISEFERTPASEARVRLIDLLGRLGDPAAPGALVAALDREPSEEELVAIDAALRRWSNSDVRRNPVAWRAWWNNLNMDGQDSRALRRLANRIAQESARADAQTRRAGILAQRIADLYVSLLGLQPESERIPRLREMLGDEEAAVRLAAVSQVERMLRDAKLPPGEIREPIVSRLGDIDPEIRIKAAKVLDAMGGDDLGPILVRSLVIESDPEVIRAGLRILGGRPQPEAVSFAIDRLESSDPEMASLSARVISAVAAVGTLHPDDREQVRGVLGDRRGVDSRDEARLAVLVASEPDEAVDLLQAEDESVRRGAAEAFRSLGRRDLLLGHATNPTVRRVAIQAWAEVDGSIGAVNVRSLLSLRPEADEPEIETDSATWRAAMVRVLEAMPRSRMIEVEELLSEETELLEERGAMLRRGVAAPDLAEGERLRLVDLLGRALLAAGRPLDAAEELRAGGADEENSPLRDLLLVALFESGEWSGAWALQPDPSVWLDFVESRAPLRPDLCGRMLAELTLRMDELGEAASPEALERLASLQGRLQATTVEEE